MPSDPEEELKRILDDSAAIAARITERGRDIAASGQAMHDWASATRSLVPLGLSPQEVEILAADWSASNQGAGILLSGLDKLDVPAVNSTAGTAAYSTAITVDYLRIEIGRAHV